MARCLVTGHKGYIGSHLHKKLKQLGHVVQGIDLQEEYSRDINSLQGLEEDQKGNFHPYFWNFRPEYIFHLACIPRVGFSIDEPVKSMKNNVIAGSSVLNFARKVGARRVSDVICIYEDTEKMQISWAIDKYKSIIFSGLKLYSELYGIDTVSLRYFNVYSKDQPADGPYATAISNWMKYIKNGKNPFITGEGNQRRDMLHVADAVEANIFAMEREENFHGQTFDVGTGENISLNEVKEMVHRHFPGVEFEYVDPRPNEVAVTLAKTGPLKKLGWKTKVNINDGVEECFKHLKEKL